MTEAISAYRRQEVLRDICRGLNYQGRYVWLVGANQVPIMASKQLGLSRLRFQIFNIMDQRLVKFVPRDGHKVKLDATVTLTALPMMRGRRRDLFIFVCPTIYSAYKWSVANGTKLSPEERSVLTRKETFDPGTTAVAHALCVYRGLIDPRGRVTELGARLLAAKKK